MFNQGDDRLNGPLKFSANRALHFCYKIFLYPLFFSCHFHQRSCQYTSHAAIRTYAHANKELKTIFSAVRLLFFLSSVFFWRYRSTLFAFEHQTSSLIKKKSTWSVLPCFGRGPLDLAAGDISQRNHAVSCNLFHASTGLQPFPMHLLAYHVSSCSLYQYLSATPLCKIDGFLVLGNTIPYFMFDRF